MTPEELERILAEAFPSAVLPTVDEVTDVGVILTLPIGERNGRPGGTVSGPTLMTLADTAAWVAVLSRIGPVLLAVTTSLHIDFLRKPEMTPISARASLLKLGSRLAVVEVSMTPEGSSTVLAQAQVTYSIPPR